MYKKECIKCSKLFETKKKYKKFCSNECKFDFQRNLKKTIKICGVCNEKFSIPNWKAKKQKFCSPKCVNVSFTKYKETKWCKTCNKQLNRRNSLYCSRECSRIHYNKNCLVCNKIFRIGLKFCSNECKFIYQKIHPPKLQPKYKLICGYCNKEFNVTQCQKHYKCCSKKCATKYLFDHSKKTKLEIKFENLLKENNIFYKTSYYVKYNDTFKVYDFFIPNKNLLIETDGIFWHGKIKPKKGYYPIQVRNMKNDKTKNRLAKDNGYNLIRIWEDEIDKFNIESLK
jgi:G:T-mismatch repair DNA endonuclease (very short patch repair protein)/predicted nucleic acid-binding Zn ribbon protein